MSRRRFASSRSWSYRPAPEVLEARALPSFLPPAVYNFDAYPSSVVAGDFTEHGQVDLAMSVVPNGGGDHVTVFRGNGDGSFQPAGDYPTGSQPISIAAGDFTGSGTLDLVTANNATGDVSVLLGNGDGSFQSPRNYPVGSGPYSVAVGDLNGDGNLDIVTANADVGTVSVLLGNGDGTFRPGQDVAVGQVPVCVALADLNGDGKLDLVTTSSGSRNISTLLGNGDGTFQAARFFPTGDDMVPVYAAVGDFTGDGILDIAVANQVVGTNMVGIYRGNGDGSFQAPSFVPTGDGIDYVAVADVTGNGKLDLLTAHCAPATDFKALGVSLGNGDGTFGDVHVYPLSAHPGVIATGDFNHDGFVDVAISTQTNVSVFLNAADWGAGPPAAPSLPRVSEAAASAFPTVADATPTAAGLNPGAPGSPSGLTVLPAPAVGTNRDSAAEPLIGWPAGEGQESGVGSPELFSALPFDVLGGPFGPNARSG